MAGTVWNPLGILLGMLIGAGGVIAFIARFDRTGESGCFYQLLLTLVGVVIAVIVLGTVTG